RFTQLVATETELLIHGTRTTSQCTARRQAYGAGVARKLLQFGLRVHLFVIGGFRAEHDFLQLGALGGVFRSQFGLLDVAVHHAALGHIQYLDVICGTETRRLPEARGILHRSWRWWQWKCPCRAARRSGRSRPRER